MKIKYADGVVITVENADVSHNPEHNEVHAFAHGRAIILPIFEGTEVIPNE